MQVEKTPEALERSCREADGHPSRRIKVIGIAGASGNTETCCLVASVLFTAGNQIGILSGLGVCDGREIAAATAATLTADELARWLARMADHDCSHAVMEVSGEALADARLGGIEFDAVCLGEMGQGDSSESGRPVDSRLLTSGLLDRLSPEGLTVINADDLLAASCLGGIDGPVLTVGIDSPAEITGVILEQCPSEQTFLMLAGEEAIPVRTRMIGRRHVYRCLTAAAVGLAYGLELTTIVRGLEAVDYVPGCLERIECGQAFGVFVDAARTPEALAAALETLHEVTAGRVICVLGGERPEVRTAARGKAFPNRAAAVRWALSRARPGDCVLIAGTGQNNEIRGFEPAQADAEVAREWLYTVGSGE